MSIRSIGGSIDRFIRRKTKKDQYDFTANGDNVNHDDNDDEDNDVVNQEKNGRGMSRYERRKYIDA